jgi:hypothetical protein
MACINATSTIINRINATASVVSIIAATASVTLLLSSQAEQGGMVQSEAELVEVIASKATLIGGGVGTAPCPLILCIDGGVASTPSYPPINGLLNGGSA